VRALDLAGQDGGVVPAHHVDAQLGHVVVLGQHPLQRRLVPVPRVPGHRDPTGATTAGVTSSDSSS
jgi:hypothetical protein